MNYYHIVQDPSMMTTKTPVSSSQLSTAFPRPAQQDGKTRSDCFCTP